MDYRIEGNQIYSEKGRVVATLDGSGNPVMEPGMSGPHKRGVEEFLAMMGSNEPRGSYEVKPAPVGPAEPEQEKNPVPEETVEQVAESSFEIGTYVPAEDNPPFEPFGAVNPPEDVPPFSKELGVNTPGFKDHIVRNKLTQAQIDELVYILSK